MKSARRQLIVVVGSFVLLASAAINAAAQTPVDPSTTPTENTGGWVFSMAQLLSVLGVGVVLFLVVMYMRYAPRFAKDEEGLKVVRADRVRPGEDLPRRAVDISQAAPVVVAPPAVPVAAGAVVAPAPVAAVTAVAPAAVVAPLAVAAPAAATPAPATEAPAAPAPAPPAPPAERPEVALDQEVFDATLAELLDKGTDRRVAEGQARRAAMIAARKKAEG
jgi:pyruvate dehydrogenase E2 component (dihydrolipoamide acetyltransferase)